MRVFARKHEIVNTVEQRKWKRSIGNRSSSIGYTDTGAKGEKLKGARKGSELIASGTLVGGFGLTNHRKRARRRPNFSNGLERILIRHGGLIRLRGGRRWRTVSARHRPGPGVELISRVGNKVSGQVHPSSKHHPRGGKEVGLNRAIFAGYPISPSPMTMAATERRGGCCNRLTAPQGSPIRKHDREPANP